MYLGPWRRERGGEIKSIYLEQKKGERESPPVKVK